MGHEIPPGASYCVQGHPIALEAMPFGNDQYGGGYGGQQPGFGAPPPQAYPPPGGYGPDPNAGFGAPPPYPDPNAGWGAPPPGHGGFGAPPPQPYGAPAPGQGGFGAPPGGFGPQPGFPPGPGYGAPAPEPAAAPAPNLPPNALRGFLVSYQSNTSGDFWPLAGGRKTVGRANSGDQIDIPLSDATISSRHAAFVIDAVSGSIQVEDTGSTNGTFVNEEHIGFNGKRELRDGDKVRFGGYSATVKIVTRI
jgi:hypothetical protein